MSKLIKTFTNYASNLKTNLIITLQINEKKGEKHFTYISGKLSFTLMLDSEETQLLWWVCAIHFAFIEDKRLQALICLTSPTKMHWLSGIWIKLRSYILIYVTPFILQIVGEKLKEVIELMVGGGSNCFIEEAVDRATRMKRMGSFWAQPRATTRKRRTEAHCFFSFCFLFSFQQASPCHLFFFLMYGHDVWAQAEFIFKLPNFVLKLLSEWSLI